MSTTSKSEKKVCVIGIGRVGLSLAITIASQGFKVYGIGRNKNKIDQINNGVMPFIEKDARPLLKKVINKSFTAVTEYSVISECDYIILTLGTPVDENMNPVYDQINDSLELAIPYFKPQQLLILRSTVSPKTTLYVKALVEEKTSLKVGKNFFLAFCPERISEGKAIEEIKSLPQIVGADEKKSLKKAQEFFKKLDAITLSTDSVSAELAKLFTNMYRYINFAIANEFMLLAKNYNRDVYEINNLVNYKYKRGGLRLPGLTAGPCLFKDGFFLINDLPFIDLISTSWKINESVPVLLVKQISERMKLEGKKVVILGLAFKAESDDIRESLSFKVRKAFLRERANVVLHDPFVKEYSNQKIESNVYKALEEADIIFIATNHNDYKKLNIQKIKSNVKKNCIVSDIWNVWGTGKIVYRINNVEEAKG